MCKNKSKFGNLLASKLPLIQTETLYIPDKVERRSAIISKIVLPDQQEILLVVTHLDAYDKTGETRRKQIQMIMNKIGKCKIPIIIMGDFNCLRRDDYIDEEREWIGVNSPGGLDYETVDLIESRGFKDLFGNLKYSVWSGRRVDYVFVKNFNRTIEGTYLYYDDISDHISLIVDFR